VGKRSSVVHPGIAVVNDEFPMEPAHAAALG
jgi:hypothetical protein